MIDLLRLVPVVVATYQACLYRAASDMTALRGVSWLRAVMLMVSIALGGCAALPGHVDRPVTFTRTDTAETTLAKAAAASLPLDGAGVSGFRLLSDGEEAIQARLALIRAAEETLDVQYYLIASDRTGLEFLAALQDAAVRGVRVRILVDDLYANGQDALFASLAQTPNLELRIFNPLPVRGDRFATRVALSLHQFTRINHRMHNKLFIADGSFAIFGGRNIADEYFDRAAHANFIDADMLASGPVVSQLGTVFDAFWNSEHSYPVQSLVRSKGVSDVDLTIAGQRACAGKCRIENTLPVVRELSAGYVRFELALAEVHADEPAKVDGDGTVEGAPSAATLALLRRAESTAFLSSPYFIPGAQEMAGITQARRAGVEVQVLTNSMQSTDEPLVYVGFAKHEAALEALGVHVFEVSAPQATGTADRGPGGSLIGSSLSRLHAKFAVVDSRWASIGSFNMDRRSALWNTEMVVHIDCAPLARQLEAWGRSNVSTAASAGPAKTAPAGGSLWQRAAFALVDEDFL